MQERFGFPDLGIGVGLRTAHYREILERSPAVDWFEVLSENFMQTRGRPLEILDQIAERYPQYDDAFGQVYLHVFSRYPTSRECAMCRDYLQQIGSRNEALEDLMWALVNSTEFRIKH